MPTIPERSTLNANSVDILNAIRNSASANYRNYVPAATLDANSVREIGAVIMDYPALQNEFLTALINRIGRVLLNSKMFSNPWAVFKKGVLEFGETVEEIFVNIAKPFEYDTGVAESEVFKREKPDVRAAFHIMNYQKFYKATIQQNSLKQAFLSWNGISDLIAKIVDSMYTGANYDEFLTMKYLLAKHILNGELYPVQVPTVQTSNMKSIVSTIKGISNTWEFPSDKYNLAGVTTHTLKENQYVIVNADFDAVMDVEVLASAFNMSKAEFMGHRVLVDSFGELNNARLAQLFADDENYTPITSEELTALSAVPAVLVDEDWFVILDNLYEFTENFNGQGMYWNYFYHVWKTFSVSPFSNSAVFVPGKPDVSSVTISPSSANVVAGQTVLLSATVATSNFASKAVKWTISPSNLPGTSITELGLLKVGETVPSGTVITATATSVFDDEVYGTATVNVYDSNLTPSIESVTVSPETASLAPGDTKQFSAEVVSKNFAAKTVTWALSPSTTGCSVSDAGLVTIAGTVSTAATLTLTATSTFDNTKSDSATISVVVD